MVRPWTEHQDEFVRRWFRAAQTHEIAELLERPTREVSERAYELGLMRRRPNGYMTPAEDATVRSMAAEGWSVTKIAERLGSDRHFVGHYVRRNRIEINPAGPHYEEGRREGLRKQRETLGIKSAGCLRSIAYRRFAESRGWPADLAPRQVQILDALYDYGPMGRREIAEIIGMPWKGTRKSLTAARLPSGSYLADLIHRELVFSVRKGLSNPGQHARDLYLLVPGIKRGDPTTWPAQKSEAIRRSNSLRSRSTNRSSRKRSRGKPRPAR